MGEADNGGAGCCCRCGRLAAELSKVVGSHFCGGFKHLHKQFRWIGTANTKCMTHVHLQHAGKARVLKQMQVNTVHTKSMGQLSQAHPPSCMDITWRLCG